MHCSGLIRPPKMPSISPDGSPNKLDKGRASSGKPMNPKGPKYLYGTKYGFCSNNFPYGLGKYTPYGYLGPFGEVFRPVIPSEMI